MQKYKEFAPTGFDSAGAFLPDQADWEVFPCGINRDSTLLDTSNWKMALKELDELEGYEVHRFGHWACGWYEVILLEPRTPAHDKAIAMGKRLADYPVLNEEDYSDREYEATLENIACQLRMMDVVEELPDDMAGQLLSWFWDNDQSAVENCDDQGGWPTDEQMAEALTELGYTLED